jgi:hypothetical protein
MLRFKMCKFFRVAKGEDVVQLVESRIPNALVVGSIPAVLGLTVTTLMW